MRPFNLTDSKTYHGLPVNCDSTMQVHREILERIHQHLTDYIRRHNKTYCLMLTLTYPREVQYPRDNDRFANYFLRGFMVDRKRHGFDPQYIWCTEKGTDCGNLHHHLGLILDGSRTQAPHNHVEVAQRVWANSLGLPDASGLVNYGSKTGESYGHLILRGDNAAMEEAFYHFSYMAKERSKQEIPEGVRVFGSSKTDFN